MAQLHCDDHYSTIKLDGNKMFQYQKVGVSYQKICHKPFSFLSRAQDKSSNLTHGDDHNLARPGKQSHLEDHSVLRSIGKKLVGKGSTTISKLQSLEDLTLHPLQICTHQKLGDTHTLGS